MRKTFATLVGVLLVAGSSRAEQPVGLDQIAPSLSQLGPGWTSNHVVVLVDQLSPTNEICNEGKGWLQAAHNVVGKRGCEAQAVFRYQCGSIGVLVWVNRYRSMKDIGEDWGRDKDTKESPGGLPKVGEEVRFYQRHGMHNNIAFRRGSYLVDIESPSAPIEKLNQLAEAFDSNLVKAQKAAGVSQPKASRSSQTASTRFVAEGSVDYHNFWAVDALKTHPEFKPVVSNTMKSSVVVSNSCYLMRLEPTKESAAGIRLSSRHKPEPTFGGRSVTQWLTSRDSETNRVAVKLAALAVGEASVPALRKMLQAGTKWDRMWFAKAPRWLYRLAPVGGYQFDRKDRAMWALQNLGRAGREATPELLAIVLDHTEHWNQGSGAITNYWAGLASPPQMTLLAGRTTLT